MEILCKQIALGDEFVVICDDCVLKIKEAKSEITVYEDKADSTDEVTCSFCYKNPVEAVCIQCDTKTFFYIKYMIPHFGGMIGLSREEWSEFLGFIGIAICKDCSQKGWDAAYLYAAGDQLALHKHCVHKCACIENGLRETARFPQIKPEHLLPTPEQK